ncbi:MAG: TolC family protein [Magnetococcales bacterium]|nr:TolC family protein [Magnetococcales bacterium]
MKAIFRKERVRCLLWLTVLSLGLGGCVVTPEPLSITDHARRATADTRRISAQNAPVTGAITLAEAMARAIRFNLDHRLKQMEEALALGEGNLASHKLLPALSMQAGYTVRSNANGATSESLISGAQSLEASTSSERASLTADLALSWNVLDFGLSYLRAKDQADRYLIAGEQRRKVIHNIIQEVRQAFWRALVAQELLPRIEAFLVEARSALNDARKAEERLLIPPLEALKYQMTLLETIYQITALERDLGVARTQLAALMNLDLKGDFVLVRPVMSDPDLPRVTNDLALLEQMALVFRPELREEDYQTRITAREAQSALLELLPGLRLDLRRSYDGNRHLFNRNWAQGGIELTWHLLQAVSAGDALDVAAGRGAVAETRRLSLGMAILTQVHVARQRYQQSLEEFELVREMSDAADRIQGQTAQGQARQATNELELIQAQARAIYRQLQRGLAYAELRNAAGRLLLSVGVDPLPPGVETNDLAGLVHALDTSLERSRTGELEWGAPLADIPVAGGAS